MSRTIGDIAERILDHVPPYLADDDTVQAFAVAFGNELQRLEDAATAFRNKMFPSLADDTYNTLSIWEGMLGLPIKPYDGAATPVRLSDAQRRAIVMANIKRRRSSAGSDWEAAISEALGLTLGVGWSYTELGPPYTVILTLPVGWPIGQALSLVRRITPAHLNVILGYGGFVIGHGISDATGASKIGQGLL